MKKTQIIWVMLLISALMIFGCDKEKQENPVASPASRLLRPDTSIPLASYVKLEDGNQLMFMHYALSGLPVDYEKIARHYSQDYRATSDVFKRLDILTALKPSIDAEIEKAGINSNRYFSYTITAETSTLLSHYNFISKSFLLKKKICAPGYCFAFGSNPLYSLAFTNGEDFKEWRIKDAGVARKIEGMISSGYKDATLTIYAFVQDADPSKGQIKAQIVTMQIIDDQGNALMM